jgi:hypothetical protein
MLRKCEIRGHHFYEKTELIFSRRLRFLYGQNTHTDRKDAQEDYAELTIPVTFLFSLFFLAFRICGCLYI